MSVPDLAHLCDAPTLAAPKPPASATNPLSAAIASNLDALKNDVEQAKELASDYQRQLAGKSNELADFKLLVEKTQNDLTHLQTSIAELRQERHRLANEAMKAEGLAFRLKQAATERVALEFRLKQATTEKEALEARLKQAATERECLVSEVEGLRRVRAIECDPRVKKLTAEKEALRVELANMRRQLEEQKKDEANPAAEEETLLRRLATWQRRPAC
jgi:chromosome segregation ATPase